MVFGCLCPGIKITCDLEHDGKNNFAAASIHIWGGIKARYRVTPYNPHNLSSTTPHPHLPPLPPHFPHQSPSPQPPPPPPPLPPTTTIPPLDLILVTGFYYASCNKGLQLRTGVHNAKAEACTTPYMHQNIKINVGMGGIHGNQFAKNRPAKIIKLRIECASSLPVTCHS